MRAARASEGMMYVAGGLWPVLHMRSFQKLTGHKQDETLVKTVGLLTAGIGLILLGTAGDKSTRRLGKASAASFGVIDFYYTITRRIRRIYAADGIVQAVLLINWFRRRHRS